MPRHAFKFPHAVADAVKRHVEQAVQATNPIRFSQEPTYVTSLITRLEGTAYDGPLGVVMFESRVFPDRGPRSLESIFGADFAITATIRDSTSTVEKSILVQAKLGEVEHLPPGELKTLREQIKKMQRLVKSPKVMEIGDGDLFRDPRIISGRAILRGEWSRGYRFSQYVTARILTTFDGATDPSVVAAIRSGSLDELYLVAKLYGPAQKQYAPPPKIPDTILNVPSK
jgi:hypothetical protein